MAAKIIEENFEMDEEGKKESIRMTEQDTLNALFKLGNFRKDEENFKEVVLKRNGQPVLTFKIRPISEEENEACLRNNSIFRKDKRTGQEIRIKIDRVKYRSELIFTATVDEDRAIWMNKKAWEAFSVVSAPDLISAVLQQGEKDRLIALISEISGYGDDYADEEETAKN